MNLIRRCCFLLSVFALGLMISAVAYGQTAASAAPPPSAAELKDTAAKAPSTADLAKGDPGGSMTGTINDVPVSDSKTGLTAGDVANQVGQNKIAINFTWTLIAAFLSCSCRQDSQWSNRASAASRTPTIPT